MSTGTVSVDVRHFIVATAGHVDHGKSTLVRALAGAGPDRLPEEKARGITIDLGFAHLRLAAPDNGSEFEIGIVDVPGHEDFVKNMVAGVGSTDLALLVVAADDGWMPQTEEHLQILEYLGVTRAVVAVTKVDRVPEHERVPRLGAIQSRLRGSAFADAPLVPLAAPDGLGLAELRRTLAAALVHVPPRRAGGRPRLWVDRVFTLKGIGVVATGSLQGGSLAVGDPVGIAPSGATARIRMLHSHNLARADVAPGTRTALNLTGLNCPLSRGDLITRGEPVEPGDACDVWLTRSSRSAGTDGTGPRVGHGTVARFHVGTTVAECRIVLAAGESLSPGESALAQLRFGRPLAMFAGERFVIRDSAGRATLAGGIVLEARAARARFRRPAQQEFLRALREAGHDAGRRVRAQLERDGFVRRDLLAAGTVFDAPEISAVVAALEAGQWVVTKAGHVGMRSAWAAAQARVVAAVAEHHRAHPAQTGLPLAQIRSLLPRPLRSEPLFDLLLAEVVRQGHELSGAAMRRRDFEPVISPRLSGPAVLLLAQLRRGGINPPGRREIAPDALREEALQFLVKTGKVRLLNADVALPDEVYRRAVAAIRSELETRGRATVSELRQALGASRRIMVPLLERLDREGVTVRDGEGRALAERRSDFSTPLSVEAAGTDSNRGSLEPRSPR